MLVEPPTTQPRITGTLDALTVDNAGAAKLLGISESHLYGPEAHGPAWPCADPPGAVLPLSRVGAARLVRGRLPVAKPLAGDEAEINNAARG
jgi:hypothetical protein